MPKLSRETPKEWQPQPFLLPWKRLSKFVNKCLFGRQITLTNKWNHPGAFKAEIPKKKKISQSSLVARSKTVHPTLTKTELQYSSCTCTGKKRKQIHRNMYSCLAFTLLSPGETHWLSILTSLSFSSVLLQQQHHSPVQAGRELQGHQVTTNPCP